MNRAPFIFLGAFAALTFSWIGVVLSNQVSYGALAPVFDETEGKVFPEGISGVAAQGKVVYQDLGCVYCHTQQVRRPDFGDDVQRKWGERGSVARDYIREDRVLLGDDRIGPDLRNVGLRLTDASWHYRHLFDPQLEVKGSTMPSYKFLFETRKISGTPSPLALKLSGSDAAPVGYEIVPTARGQALVTYLLSLKDTYNYPDEAKRVYKEPKKEAGKPEGKK